MSIAQQLYEGVDITGEGTVGLITYMRTDSLRLSEEAIAAAKGFIESRYGREYYPPKARHYKTKGNAQDAHEAIRPLRRESGARGHQEGPDHRAVPALQADLEPFSCLSDGLRRVRQRLHRGPVRRLLLPGQPV